MSDELAEGDDAAHAGTEAPTDTAELERRRVTRWDRPPEPHDWRWYVRGVGKILIALGLLMFGFVAYQLWGTGIETARAQNRLEDEFEQLLAEQSTTTVPTTTAPPTTTPSTQPATTTAPSTSTSTTTAPTTTVARPLPDIERGQVLAKLEIPRIGKEGDSALYVVPGVGLDDLKKGPGHYPDTPLPGQLGNAAIAGHRTTFGEPFRNIDKLRAGDEIVVTMITGERFVYEVTEWQIVEPSDYHVVATTDPTVAQLTLTSCHPAFSARQRIAVHAVLRPEKSAPVAEPTYYDLDGEDGSDSEEDSAETGDETVDDPVIAPDDTAEAPGTTDETASSTTDDAAADSADDPANGAADPGRTPPTAEVQDAFAEGWFHDNAAWPHILVWGGALVLIGLAVSRISRHFRRYSVGIAAGAIPFVVCLYFFYQNVNRLLPPGF